LSLLSVGRCVCARFVVFLVVALSGDALLGFFSGCKKKPFLAIARQSERGSALFFFYSGQLFIFVSFVLFLLFQAFAPPSLAHACSLCTRIFLLRALLAFFCFVVSGSHAVSRKKVIHICAFAHLCCFVLLCFCYVIFSLEVKSLKRSKRTTALWSFRSTSAIRWIVLREASQKLGCPQL